VSFRWRYLTESGTEQTGPDETFEDQTEAEAWFSDEWPALLDSGIDAVTLLDGDTEVYGPMSLHEA
jgi:hypothetical protein